MGRCIYKQLEININKVYWSYIYSYEIVYSSKLLSTSSNY